MKSKAKRILAALLALCMVVTTWTPAMTAEAKTELVNVALNATASTESGQNENHGISNVNDGDDTTSWQTPGAWPSTAVLTLDRGRIISKVVVKLGEKGDNSTGRTALVTVKYAQNGVISDLLEIGSKRMTVDSDGTFELTTPVSASHIYVVLSDPQNADGTPGTFWPSVEEIEAYEEQDVEMSKYNNIASQAVVSVTGNNEHPSDGRDNLVDGNVKTLYKFYNAAMTSEQTITLTYDQARAMDAFSIAFENVGTSDSNNFSFEYSILAKNSEGTYDTIVANKTANRTDNSSQTYQISEKAYSEVKIVMHSCKAGNSAGWPAIAEFEVYGEEIKIDDSDSIAFGKPVHVSSGKNQASNITDGSVNSTWRGSYYPAYVDIDLEANYFLDTVEVFTPENGYSQYSIYTSMDGRNFEKLAEKTSTDSASLATGEVYQANRKEARIVRVYMEYNSVEVAAVLNEVRVTGELSNTPVQERPEIDVVPYAESEYAKKTIKAEDTYKEVYGIIERRLGAEYKSWFTLQLAENPNGTDYDYYELSMVDGKVCVKGNDGVSLATGINHYLKYYCNVNISQVGDQAKMPATIPTIEGTVHKETKARVRYSYNYCTLSYSMAFWGEKEWRDELDWLALNGVNVVLDATAQEEVWRRFLGKIGYSHEDIKDYIAGPAYYAWAYMANLSGFGGPVHDSWFEERTELARKNQEIMRTLGMQPVLQGYSGMVPTDIRDYDSSAQIIEQGLWCSFQRPAMLVTTSSTFDKYAKLFYECQKEVYGDVSDYYATDPFHEGGNTGGMNSSDIAEQVLISMLEADEDSIWIIQAWQGNPTTALLNGLDRVTNGAQHALVLDLYAEKTPHYNETGNSYGDSREFDDTPWLFCMLNNFGGRLGLHGHLDNLANNIPTAFNNGNHIAGIGITPEASVNNPVLYDFLFETIWQDDATKTMQVINLDNWLADYAERRYGAASESANAAWAILKDTVYKSSLNNLGQGAPESVVNARPALTISAASTWGNAIISYDKYELERAAKLLLKDYETLKGSEGYLYDVATVLQQVLSNSAQEYQKKMAAAFNSRDLASFEKYAATFMEIIGAMEKVTSTSEYYLLGRWVEQAKALGKNADDFTKELYEFNAKALVTTWGSYNQAERGGLKDYSNRQWSGLINDFYKVRWQRWITARTNELKGQTYESNINWFEWEWSWVRGDDEYTTTPTARDLSVLGAEILEKYSVFDEAMDDSRDVDPKTMSVVAGTQSGSDPASNVLDGNTGSIWHSQWGNVDETTRDKHHLTFTFDGVTTIDGMRYLQRNNGVNGAILKYDLYVSTSDTGEDWTQIVDDGTFENNTSWQLGSFEATEAKRVKLVVVDAMSDQSGKVFASAAEIRFTTPQSEENTGIGTLVTEGTLSEYDNIANQSTIATTGNEDLDPQYGGPSGNLVDGSLTTLYKFHKDQMTDEKEITLTYDELKTMDAVRISFENVTSDQYNYKFTYSILAKKADGTYDTIVAKATANRTDNSSQGYTFPEGEYSEIKIVMHSCTTGDGSTAGWPSVAEFEIYGTDVDTTPEVPETADKTALAEAIATVETLNADDYTADSWTALQVALATAIATNENDSATQEEVDEALADLQAAKEALELKEVAVNIEVEVGQSFPVKGTVESDSSYDAEIIDVRGGSFDSSTNVDIANMEVGESKMMLLVFTSGGTDYALTPNNKTGYNGSTRGLELKTFNESTASDYYWMVTKTADGYKIQTTSLEGEQKYIIAGWENIELGDSANATIFQFEYDQASSAYKISYFSNNTKRYFNNFGGGTSLIAGWEDNNRAVFKLWAPTETVITGKNVGTTDIRIGDTLYKVTVVPGKTELLEEIAATKTLKEDDCTADSWTALQAALAAAATVIEDENATQEEVDEALAGLRAAKDALVWKDKTVTIKVGDTIRLFNQSGTFDKAGLDTLETTIAGVTVETKTINDKVAKLYDGSSYDVDSALGDCIYSFNRNADGTYTISATTADGTRVYLNPRTKGQLGYPNSTTAEKIVVEAADGGFILKDYSDKKADGENYCLTYKQDWKVFNEEQSEGVTTVFKLYELKKTTTASGDVYEYEPVTEVYDGGQYVIMAEFTDKDGNEVKYALHPSDDLRTESDGIGRNSHVAKVTGEYATIAGNEILVRGISEGQTSATVGKVKYNINVVAAEEYIMLKVGESYVIDGTTVTQAPDSQYVTDKVAALTKVEMLKELKDAGKYIIVSAQNAVKAVSKASTGKNPNGLEIKDVGTDFSSLYWKIIRNSDGTYSLQDPESSDYMNFGAQSGDSCGVALGDNAQKLGIETLIAQNYQGFSIGHEGMHLNTYGGIGNGNAAGYTGRDDGSTWNIYKSGIEITGAAVGETTAVIDGITYHITVVETQIASGIGTSTGQEVNRLSISADNTFDLNIINSDSTNITWEVFNLDGTKATWAEITEDGQVSAVNKDDHVNTYEGYIVATVDGQEFRTELKVSPAPTAENKRLYDVYIGELYHTDVYYGWIYEYDDASTESGKAYGSSELTQVVEGEVIYVSMGSDYENALDFFAKPEDGYALTQMGATGSSGHYMRLEGETPEETEFIASDRVAGNQQYHDIDKAATVALVQKAMDAGCHGAQGFTRYVGDGGVPSILNYRSEKLPTVKKEVMGILGTDGKADSYREYTDGMTAQIGEYVYFHITVDTYDAEDLITYSDMELNDQLEGATFFVQDEDKPTNSGSSNVIDITTDINADGLEGKTHDYYVVYQIQAKDITDISHSIINIVGLSYDYETHYSNGTFGGAAQDNASILITDVILKNMVVDFGLPVTYTFETASEFQDVNDVETVYGKVTITSEPSAETDGVYINTVTYTPTKMLQGRDAIALTEVGTQDIFIAYVYPATSVYYEEGFADYDKADWGNNISKGEGQQTYRYLDDSLQNIDNYGYDEKYADEANGPSNGSEAVSSKAGNGAVFTFTGNGVDVYANCQGGATPTGTASIIVRDTNNNDALKKLMIVNTKIAGSENGATSVQNSIGNAYNIPIASVNDLEHGTYSVTIRHTRTAEEVEANTTYPVKLDGFRVYNTLEDSSVFELHHEANPNFVEMRNVVLNSLSVNSSTSDDYAEDIANGLTQVLDKNEAATGVIVTNSITSDAYVAENAQDLLDNGPKNELFLYSGQTLVFNLASGLKNVQIGMKAVNGQVNVSATSKATDSANTTTLSTIPATITSSTDMFYVIGDINADTTITITNNGSGILSITDLKYFVEASTANVFKMIEESDLVPVLQSMGYDSKVLLNPFEDVKEVAYFFDAVLWAVKNRITDGWTETTFAPEMGCTRGQVVTFLWRAAGQPKATSAENPFVDVAENAYYYDAVLWAVENGITDGWTEDTFAPDMECTRGQIVTFIWRAAGEPEVPEISNPFVDVAENAYYYDAVLWAVENGITEGWLPAEFAPDMECVRGQIVTFLYRAR